jgi:hypothetical protein
MKICVIIKRSTLQIFKCFCVKKISFQLLLFHDEVEEVFITTSQIYDSFSQERGELAFWNFCVLIKRGKLQIVIFIWIIKLFEM